MTRFLGDGLLFVAILAGLGLAFWWLRKHGKLTRLGLPPKEEKS